MNLDEWSQISDLDQRELIISWKRSGLEFYLSLAESAAERLKFDLLGIDEVTDVQVVSGGFIVADPICPVVELKLAVCTVVAFPKPIIFPKVVNGFRTMRIDYGPKRDAYIATWKRFFREIKDWTEDRTLEWISRFIEDLEGRRDSVIYSYFPIIFALRALLTDRERSVVGGKMSDLYRDLADAVNECTEDLEVNFQRHPDLFPEFDWGIMKAKINQVLARYLVK